MHTALQGMFALYGALGLVAGWIYSTLPKDAGTIEHIPAAPFGQSKKVVFTLAALFSLDSFGSGLVVQFLVAMWLFQKFHLSIVVAGTIFFWTGVLSALSYLVAVKLANR